MLPTQETVPGVTPKAVTRASRVRPSGWVVGFGMFVCVETVAFDAAGGSYGPLAKPELKRLQRPQTQPPTFKLEKPKTHEKKPESL